MEKKHLNTRGAVNWLNNITSTGTKCEKRKMATIQHHEDQPNNAFARRKKEENVEFPLWEQQLAGDIYPTNLGCQS